MVKIRITNKTGTRNNEKEKTKLKINSFFTIYKKAFSLREFSLDTTYNNYIYIIILNIFYGINFAISRNIYYYLITKIDSSQSGTFKFNFWSFIWAPPLILIFQIISGIIFYIYQKQNIGRIILLMTLLLSHCIIFFFLNMLFYVFLIFLKINAKISLAFIISLFLTGYLFNKNYPLDLMLQEERDYIIFYCVKFCALIILNLPYFL